MTICCEGVCRRNGMWLLVFPKYKKYRGLPCLIAPFLSPELKEKKKDQEVKGEQPNCRSPPRR